MDSWFNPWTWLAAGAVLAGLEILAPGAFMIWLAGAAFATAIVTALFGPPWAVQLLVFAMLAPLAVVLGRAYLKKNPIKSSEPSLNRRADRMVGDVVTLVTPIVDGSGKAQVGDAPWLVRGPDLPKGARVRILAVDGATLVVEAE
jgi:inner membrane protein